MLQYVFNTDLGDDDPVMFCAEDQCWDEATLEQLKNEYNVVFMTGGDAVIPVMIVDSRGKYPLFVIGSEDDGTIHFERKYGQFRCCFSAYWAKSLIADLEEALKICSESINSIVDAVDEALKKYSSDNVDVIRNEETGMIDVIYHSDNNSFAIYSGVIDYEYLNNRNKQDLIKELDVRHVGHCW